MTVEEYTELAGSSAVDGVTEADIARVTSKLETLLGYTLDPEEADTNQYTEQGISPVECPCLVSTDNLNPADSVHYAYRVYPYNPKDTNLFVDPFTTLYKVKLVQNNVTVKVFDADEYRRVRSRGDLARFIQVCETCFCKCQCTDCVELAVDAHWNVDLPLDLQYVLVDMIGYFMDCKSNIKSETIGPHSYTKFDNTPAEDMPINLKVLQSYAGPYGLVSRMPTI